MTLSYFRREPTTVFAPAAGVHAPATGITPAQTREKSRGGWLRRGAVLGALMACSSVVVAGCDDGDQPMEEEETDTEGMVDFDPEDPAQQDLELLVEDACAQIEQCNCGEVVFGDDSCMDAKTRLWTDRLAFGRDHELTYDRNCVAQQMQTLPNMGCGEANLVDGELHLCDDFCAVFHGDKAEGSACIAYDNVVSDCAQGLTCEGGTCVSPCAALSGLTQGQQCSNDMTGPYDDCARGLFCDWNTSKCLKLPERGEFCDSQCSEGLYCDWNTSTCQLRAAEGQDCQQAQCEEGLFCRYQDSGPPNYTPVQTCVAPGSQGESCIDFWYCEPGLACTEAGICDTLPVAGELCAEGRCAEGAYCDWSIERCVEPPSGIGQPCPQGVCAWGLWCDQSQDPNGECLETYELAAPCTGHSQCESGFCPRGYCLPRPELGEDCSDTGACASGLVCNGRTCQLAQARGPAVCIYDGW